MNVKKCMRLTVLSIALLAGVFASCHNDDPSTPMEKGSVEFEITDAPVDDASVKGVFVTIADLKIAGNSVDGFVKQTVDLKAYREGNTKSLFEGSDFDAKAYNNVTLVLDYERDADGNAPGCYVLTQDDAKYDLRRDVSASNEISVNEEWEVAAGMTSQMVIDFDLRKSIRYADDEAIRYTFAPGNELSGAIRVVARESTGMVEGTYEAGENDADRIIVYAYRQGTFDAATETEGEVVFPNAVTSAEVKGGISGNTFTLAFLEEGEYELYFAAHNENESGRLMFESMLESETTVGGEVMDVISVDAGVTLTVSSVLEVL